MEENNIPLGFPEVGPDDVVEHEIVDHPAANTPWTEARRVALQILYEVDSAGHPVGTVMTEHLAYHQLPPQAVTFLQSLVLSVMKHRLQLDAVIRLCAPEFPLEQVAVVDRNVLRMAVCEFAVLTHTPLKVAIDEAVRLAKVFGSEGSPRFVNGVLGTLADDPRALREVLRQDDSVQATANTQDEESA